MPRKTHGQTGTRLYKVWKSMRVRCYNPNRACYKNYGGRGITICEEWNDFTNFREWAIKNGYDENADFGKCTIDRIDNNGNYEPSNCRWVDRKVQNNNSRNNHCVEFNGERKTITAWAEGLDMTLSTLRHRLDRGWAMADIVATPQLPCRRDNVAAYYRNRGYVIEGQIGLDLEHDE